MIIYIFLSVFHVLLGHICQRKSDFKWFCVAVFPLRAGASSFYFRSLAESARLNGSRAAQRRPLSVLFTSVPGPPAGGRQPGGAERTPRPDQEHHRAASQGPEPRLEANRLSVNPPSSPGFTTQTWAEESEIWVPNRLTLWNKWVFNIYLFIMDFIRGSLI